MIARVALALGLYAVVLGCSSSSPSSTNGAGGAGTGTPSGVTFHKDLEPVLQRSCQSCHVSGGIAPFPLLDYEQTKPFAALMVAQTASRTMPPWHAQNTDECTVPLPWKHDTRLSDEEIALFAAWRDAGTPEGDPNDAPTPLEPSTGLPGVQLELKPAEPYTLEPGADEFRCFILDPQLPKTAS